MVVTDPGRGPITRRLAGQSRVTGTPLDTV
jgi:hypothetical protein